MKKMLMALAIIGSTYGSAEAQYLQSIYNSLTQFGPYTPPAAPVKKVVMAPRKRKKKVKPPEIQQNFQVCVGHARYYICNEQPVDSNSTHPILARNLPKVKFNYDGLYDMGVDPKSIARARVAPQQQSYPHKMGQVSPSSYVILYPKVNSIAAGNPHKAAAEPSYPYEKIPRAQYDGRQKNEERNENVNTPNERLMPSGGE